MLESDLQLGNDLTRDREDVYDQMKTMKKYIRECDRKEFAIEDTKEDFSQFKQNLLNQCDQWVESQRAKIDEKFAKI